jgi:outer membrane protein assembly factor BamB
LIATVKTKDQLMKNRLATTVSAIAIVLATLFSTSLATEQDAKMLLEMSGSGGGFVVHLGCDDGRLTTALATDDTFTVHGLTNDAERVIAARNAITKAGVYGRASVELFAADRLPYTDNLINLVVAEDVGNVSDDEILRVLAPGGVLLSKTEDGWRKTVKPWPDNIDEWSHFLHSANNNAVAKDSVVGPPRNLQWIAPPRWLRSHETPSGIQSSVSAGGRLVYVFDEGPVGVTDPRLPDHWSLICRDAFNGRLLWKKPLGPWGWREWSRERWEGKDWLKLRAGRTDVPSENQRRIVAGKDRIYTTLEYRAPLSILDAATGEVIKTVDGTKNVKEILLSDGVVVTLCETEAGDVLVAADAMTGETSWRKKPGAISSLGLAIDGGRVICPTSNSLTALDLKTGKQLWQVTPKKAGAKTLIAVDGVIVIQSGSKVTAFDATDGQQLWQQTGPSISGAEAADLFVIDGLVYRGMISVDDQGKPSKKSPNAMVIGRDLRTGDEKRRVRVDNLRSPEHHHRCYRNKATERYLISSFEGAEFLDFQEDDHGQHNWLRGACKNGMMPCNGMLYVPPDQCFCQPGAKLLGYSAVKAESSNRPKPVDDADRLTKGPAYAESSSRRSTPDASDWPTFRHDAARSGSTKAAVATDPQLDWQVTLGGRLTAPVVAAGKLFVAQIDAHTVHAVDVDSGAPAWRFTAGGRIDSPPTIHNGLVLFGSADGRVYCLQAGDGQLVWRFLAAPYDERVGHFDQIESAWPVHGSVLIDDGVAYFAAGRSTYLNGGIRVYGLNPRTGEILHQGKLEGPHRSVNVDRDLAFFIEGANSDVLVSEGDHIYMRQKKMTRELDEVVPSILSSKGAQDVGLHVFSTAGLLDDSWYNRTFWMYSRRWPGFQLANQAPKAGQLLVVDEKKTYALRVFYRRNVHSPMFFPGKDGYLLFADLNTNEPQIVGEEGAKSPIEWLPQSDYSRARGNEVRKLDSPAFGTDKMIGYTRAEPPVWMRWAPVRVRGMVKAGDTLFAAGVGDKFDSEDPYSFASEKQPAKLVALSAESGEKLGEWDLPRPPRFDGLIAAQGCLFAALTDGSVVCLKRK